MGAVMAETVTLPAIGPVKKQWLWAGVALTAGIVGYAWWVRGRDSGGGVTEVELEPEAGGGPAPSPTPGGTVDTTGGDQITTNQQWSDAVVKALSNVGYEPGFVATALGKYLGQRPLTSDEEDVIRTAWALVGRPPSGNFPITSDPEPDPEPDKPSKPDPVTGLTGRAITRNTIQLAWAPVPGATRYDIRRTGGGLGTSDIVSWTGTTYTNTRHLKANTTYTWSVRAVNDAGKSAYRSINVRTEK